jgi:hypothetical protein
VSGYVASIARDPRARRAAGAARIVVALGLHRARRSGPLVEVIGRAPARAARGAFWRAVADVELDRRRRRNRRLRRSLVLGALALVAIGQSSRRRAHEPVA